MSTSEHLQEILTTFKKEQLGGIEQRADAGDAEAQFTLGVLYANGRGVKADPVIAAGWLEKAAEQGVVAAQTLLGWFHANGEGVVGSPAKARRWYLEAAKAGDADAQCSLADLLLGGGPGIARDHSAILRWYQAAAEQGHPKAQFMLGKLLAEGELAPENDEAAFQWLTLAIMNGSEPAQKELKMLTARFDPDTIETYKQRMMDRMQPTSH